MAHKSKTITRADTPIRNALDKLGFSPVNRSPAYETGLDLIEERRAKALLQVTNFVRSPNSPEDVKEFDKHVCEVLVKAIVQDILSPEKIPEELQKRNNLRENLLLVDLMIWHTFSDATHVVPVDMLELPLTGGFDGRYIAAFKSDQKLFWRLRELDTAPGFTLQDYKVAISSCDPSQVLRVLRARCLDNSTLVDESAVPLYAGVTGTGFEKPSAVDWAQTRTNVAESVLNFWVNIADYIGHHPLVADMKDFAVKTLYPGIWDYARYELHKLANQIDTTKDMMSEMKQELEDALKARGIDAEVIVREKSKGSLGLKVRERTESLIKTDLYNSIGLPRENIEVRITDPRVNEIVEGEKGITISLCGVPAKVELVEEGFRIKYSFPTDDCGSFEAGSCHTNQVGHWQNGPSIFRPSVEFLNDLIAGKIVVKSIKGNTREQDLISWLYSINGEVLGPIIYRILREYNITESHTSIHDFFKRPDKEYVSLHVDTRHPHGLPLPSFVPFEWILRTEKIDRECEHGKYPHIRYKEEGKGKGARPDVVKFVMGLGDRLLTKANAKPVQEGPKEKHFKVNVNVGGCNLVSVSVKDGETFLDALAKAVQLGGVARVTDKSGTPVTLSVPVIRDCELVVVMATTQNDAMFVQHNLARSLIEFCKTPGAQKQLRDIMNGGKGRGKK